MSTASWKSARQTTTPQYSLQGPQHRNSPPPDPVLVTSLVRDAKPAFGIRSDTFEAKVQSEVSEESNMEVSKESNMADSVAPGLLRSTPVPGGVLVDHATLPGSSNGLLEALAHQWSLCDLRRSDSIELATRHLRALVAAQLRQHPERYVEDIVTSLQHNAARLDPWAHLNAQGFPDLTSLTAAFVESTAHPTSTLELGVETVRAAADVLSVAVWIFSPAGPTAILPRTESVRKVLYVFAEEPPPRLGQVSSVINAAPTERPPPPPPHQPCLPPPPPPAANASPPAEGEAGTPAGGHAPRTTSQGESADNCSACCESEVRVAQASEPRSVQAYRGRPLLIATWNILSLSEPGSAEQIGGQLERLGVKIMAMQEVRQQGQRPPDVPHPNYSLLYQGHESKFAQGTGFMVRNDLLSAVYGWEAPCARMSRIDLHGKPRDISLITVHAPGEASDDREKDAFYADLQALLDAVPRGAVPILLGDLNARVGRERGARYVTGSESLHTESNDNGRRLLAFAGRNGMVVRSTMESRPKLNKITWLSDDKLPWNQTDHVLVPRRHKEHVRDVRSEPRATWTSDHAMVTARVTLQSRCEARRQQMLRLKRINMTSTAS